MTPEEREAYAQLGKDLNAKTVNPNTLGQRLPSSETYSTTTTVKETVAGAATGAIGFSLSNAATKLGEAAKATFNTFAGSTPFAKLGANLPSFGAISAAVMKSNSALSGGVGNLVNQQIAGIQNRALETASASSVKAAAGVSTVTNDHIISLVDDLGYAVPFDVMPEVVESRTVQYEAVAPAQFPGAFQKYKGTDSVQWTLNVTFIARTSREAARNLRYLNRLRGWTMPYFGSNTAAEYKGQLGAPPPVLTLSGLRKKIIGPVPVVITSLNWNWPKDVDYLPCENELDDNGAPIPFPAVMNIAIQCVESFSTSQFNKFSLQDYRSGNMVEAFNTVIVGEGNE
jgi:hypothetical protein